MKKHPDPYPPESRVRSMIHRDLAGVVVERIGFGDIAELTVRLDDGTVITRPASTWEPDRMKPAKAKETEGEGLF